MRGYFYKVAQGGYKVATTLKTYKVARWHNPFRDMPTTCQVVDVDDLEVQGGKNFGHLQGVA